MARHEDHDALNECLLSRALKNHFNTKHTKGTMSSKQSKIRSKPHSKNISLDMDYWLNTLSPKRNLNKVKYDETLFKNLKRGINLFTTDIKAFNELKQCPKLFYRLCFMVYDIEKNQLDGWRSYIKDYDPRYFFDSILFVPELEKVRFDAFKAVYSEYY